MFSGTTVRELCIVCVSSHSSGVGIIHHFFLWVPYSVRNVLKKIDIFSQSARPVGKLNKPITFVSQAHNLCESSPFTPDQCIAMFRV